MKEGQTLELRIHAENLPGTTVGGRTGVRVGVQKGQEVEQDVPADSVGAVFTATLGVRRDANDDRPVFSGPYAHGTPKDRFLYLSWGQREGGDWAMFSRTKIPLQGMAWDSIMAALDGKKPLEVAVNLTSDKGGIATATLKGPALRWL
jgi:hypothetical protein